MVAKPVSGAGSTNDTQAQARLQEAQARMKSATDRHAAIVDVLSRVGVSAQDKRSAQMESKKVERELREARRLLEQSQATARS